MSNWRKNMFDGSDNDVAITIKLYEIINDPFANIAGIRLDEGVFLEGVLPFNNNVDYEIIEDYSGAVAMTEVTKGSQPSAGQFRVDYDSEGYLNTGFVNFNASDVGKFVFVKYRGTGTIVKENYTDLQAQFFTNIVADSIQLIGQNSSNAPTINEVATDLNANSDTKTVTQKGINTDVDAKIVVAIADLVTKSTTQTITGAKTFTTANVNLSGVDIKRDGNFFIGNDDLGNVVKIKRLTGNTVVGPFVTITHGIANADTDKRIFSATLFMYIGSGMNSGQKESYASYNETEIFFQQEIVSPWPYVCTILYI